MKHCTLLVVSNCNEDVQTISETVSNSFSISSLENSQDVVDLLTSKNKPNLILLDVSKNPKNYELAQTIKNDSRTSETPIIFILNRDNKEDIERCFEYGAADIITKPFYSKEIIAKIKNITQLFRLRDALEDRQRHLVTVKRQLNAIDEHVLYVSLDLETNIKDVSTAFMHLLHCSKESFIKKNEHCLSEREIGSKRFNEIFKDIKNNEPYELEIKTKTYTEKDIWLGVKIAKDRDYFGNHIGYIASFQDNTNKKIIEKKNQELDTLNHELDENLMYLRQFKQAVEEASIFSITNSRGIITEVNKNFETISGYSKEELIDQPHNIVRHEDMPKEVFRDMWETIKSGKIWKGKVKNKSKDSSPYYVISEIVPIQNRDGSLKEYISIRSDITELEEYRQILTSELNTKNKSLEEKINFISQYEEVINDSLAILKTDLNHIVHYANDKFCELSGYTQEEVIGMDSVLLRDAIHRSKDDCEFIANELRNNRAVSKTMTNLSKNGDKYYTNTLFYPIVDVEGNVIENIQTMSDISEIVKLNEEIIETQREVVFTMGAVGEKRSQETGNHVKRVAEYSYLLASLYGMDEVSCELLRQASPMHDIGKVAIPDAILNKPAKLTNEEYKIMKTHAQLGYEMLKHSNRPILKASAQVAYTHHEKYDGSGYPNGLKGEDIPIFGRITAITDVFDALGNDRVYKKAWDLKDILELFKEQKSKHFDPHLIDLFFQNIEMFLEIRDKYNDL